MPRVSVIIPLFEMRALVMRAVHSVLAQGMQDFELVVVDDGSTDGGGERVRSLIDPRVRVMRTANRGPGAARNAGVRATRAAWIALLNADDEWRPEFLERTLAAAQAAPECVAVYTGVCARGSEPHAGTFGGGWVRDYHATRMAHGAAMTPSSVLLRRDALVKCGGFHEGHNYAEDIVTWLRLSCTGPFYYIAESLCLIELAHAGSLTRSLGHRQRAAGLAYLAASFESLRSAGLIPAAQLDATRRFIEHQRGREALHLALAGERRESLRLLQAVPFGRHTWRDHARVWRTLLSPRRQASDACETPALRAPSEPRERVGERKSPEATEGSRPAGG